MAQRRITEGADTPSLAYQEMSPTLEKMAAIYGGNETMRKAGESFCKRLQQESSDSYKKRLNGLAIQNHLKTAITGFVGRIFAKPTLLGEDASPRVHEWYEDIDRFGNKADVIWRKAVTAGIRDGISWVLVDMPINKATNRQEERIQGIRPYVRVYTALDVIYVNQDDMGRVVDFRVMEKITVNVSDFAQEVVQRVRRYTPQLCTVYDLTRDTVEDYPYSFPYELGVPVVPYITDEECGADFFVRPPLLDMANLTARLWQSQSEQDMCLQIARCPMLFGRGFTLPEGQQGVIISPDKVYCSEDSAADLKWVEHSGAALGAGLDDINQLKMAVQAEGLKPLVADVERTAYEIETDEARATAPIRAMADSAHDMIENVLQYMEIYVDGRIVEGASVNLNSNFDVVTMDSASLDTLKNLYAVGAITQETYLREMIRRQILTDDLNIFEEMEATSAVNRI